jgi:hypothetical protein
MRRFVWWLAGERDDVVLSWRIVVTAYLLAAAIVTLALVLLIFVR